MHFTKLVTYLLGTAVVLNMAYTTRRYTYSALHTCVFPQILSYKIFSSCEQILKIDANDASGKMLQSTKEPRHGPFTCHSWWILITTQTERLPYKA